MQLKIPIAGIYSLPILSHALLPKIGATSRNVLLVTMQSTSGTRQGISKAGNWRVRTLMIELGWSWLRYQPNSALSRGFVERFEFGSE